MKDFSFECAQYVAKQLEGQGYEASVAEEYSGRAMYGRTCVGIVTDAPDVWVGFFVCQFNDSRVYEDKVRPPMRSDDMGLQKIYY